MSNVRHYAHQADSAILTRCVLAAAEVQDRMRKAEQPVTPPMFRRVDPPPPRTWGEITVAAIREANFTAHERAVIRALQDRFTLSQAMDIVLRDRKATP